jgi:hypothetical protein
MWRISVRTNTEQGQVKIGSAAIAAYNKVLFLIFCKEQNHYMRSSNIFLKSI